MKKIFSIIIFISFSLSCFSQYEKIKNFQKQLIDYEITGSNIAMVYKNGEVIYYNIQNSGKVGDKNINSQSYKPYQETIFPIWSMSKPITTVGIMILLEKGLVNLEDNISKFIPELGDMKCESENGVYPCKNEIKIIDLLTHRSGFGYYGEAGYGYGFTNTIKYDNLENFAKDLSNVVFEFEPGTNTFME
jgi:Beta-lactamase class C and other penicillin binding proteins